jgi:2-polyprenyl-6-hydroxyphenyl methylase/3-demethylubiquinone-9 3-methyltransferase
MLDYGGGTGTFARLMQEVGFDMVAWDPFIPGDYPAAHSYDFVTSFEVLEHTHDPHKTLAEISGFLKKGGVFFFSTGTHDEVSHLGMTDWYIAPRNGHVTIYSEASLNALFEAHGFQINHLNRWSHVAMKMVD